MQSRAMSTSGPFDRAESNVWNASSGFGAPVELDPLLAYESEAVDHPIVEPAISLPSPKTRSLRFDIALVGLFALAGMLIGAVSYSIVQPTRARPATLTRARPATPSRARAATPAATGLLTVHSTPEGARVAIDDEARGRTPLKVVLPVGAHQLKVESGSQRRTIRVSIEAGADLSQYIDFAPAGPRLTTGQLEVTSNPPGADVRIDGVLRGKTPLIVPSLTA